MKKSFTIALAILATLCSFNAAAQTDYKGFGVGDQRVSIGVGTPRAVGKTVIPAIYGSYEQGLFGSGNFTVGVGGEVEASKSSASSASPFSSHVYETTYYSLRALIKGHYAVTPQVEISCYAGLGYGNVAIGDDYFIDYNNVGSLDRDYNLGGLDRTVGIEASYSFASNKSAFIDVNGASSLGSAQIRIGMSFSF